MARPERFELPTLCFEGRCSIQLSYGREDVVYRKFRGITKKLDKLKLGGRKVEDERGRNP